MEGKRQKPILLQLNLLLLCSLLVGTIITVVLARVSCKELEEYFATSNYAYYHEIPFLESFQAFVTEHDLGATDAYDIMDWVLEEKPAYISVARNDVLLFDYAYQYDMVGLHSFRMQAYSYRFNTIWAFQRPILFADGEADVYIDDGSMRWFYLVATILSAAIGIAVMLLIIAFVVRRQIRHILSLQGSVRAMEEGNLYQMIQVASNNEIGMLAKDIEQTRLALICQNEKRKQAENKQREIVMGIAHDLRTPLTAIMNCHSLIRSDIRSEKGREEAEALLDQADGKIEIISGLAEELMVRFSEKTYGDEVFLPERSTEYSLEDYISNLISMLQRDGFLIETTDLQFHPVMIRTDDRHMARILDNIYSNIRKYAVRNVPVRISSAVSGAGDGRWSVTFKNGCEESVCARWEKMAYGTLTAGSENHGIGIRNIRILMMQMGGQARDRAQRLPDGGYAFCIELSFPVCSR